MAADATLTFKRSQERLIVSALREYGSMGVDAIAAHCGLLPHAVGKRMMALEANAYIRLTGKLVKSDSGRMQREWESV
jgi:predicted ArsR family transcriptional regulator